MEITKKKMYRNLTVQNTKAGNKCNIHKASVTFSEQECYSGNKIFSNLHRTLKRFMN